MGSRLVLNADIGAFNASWGANRFAVRSADNTWFFAFQDGVMGKILWLTPNGMREIPLDPIPTMRPTLYADPSGLYCIAGFDGNKKNILVWYIDDYKSVFNAGGTDPRVNDLFTQISNLNTRLLANENSIIAIETALGNINPDNAALDPKDRKVLNRLRGLMGLDE